MDSTALATLKHFRGAIYRALGLRKDSLFELLEAALAAPGPATLVRLSLPPVFRRGWASAADALADGSLDEEGCRRLVRRSLAEQPLAGRPVWAVDGTVWPRPAAATSFTLARRAIDSEHALLWRRTPGAAASSPSLSATASALYAPMVRAGRAVGAVHLDTVSTTTPLASRDLPRLGVMANIIGAAIDLHAPTPFPRLPGIFVSYAHADGDFVRRLVGDLRRRQIRVWLDERLRSGEAWRQQLHTAIGAADALLLVLSPASVTSEYVQWEIGVANDLNKLLVPVVHQPYQPPEALQELQYISLEKDYAAGLQNLRERLMPLTERAT